MEASEMIVMFLDIDGVLLPFGGISDDADGSSSRSSTQSNACLFPDATLQAFSMILEECRQRNLPQVALVLSSTWRVDATYRQAILLSFADYARRHGGPLVEATNFFDVTDLELHTERQHEIYAWLRSYENGQYRNHLHGKRVTTPTTDSRPSVKEVHPRIVAWLALDDEELIEGPTNHALSSIFQGHVIKTDSSVGLTREDAKQALARMESQLSSPGFRGSNLSPWI